MGLYATEKSVLLKNLFLNYGEILKHLKNRYRTSKSFYNILDRDQKN